MNKDTRSPGCSGGNSQSSDSHDQVENGHPTDPICGMTVDPAQAKNSFEHEGTMYFFCCSGCLKKFVLDPEKYINSAS